MSEETEAHQIIPDRPTVEDSDFSTSEVFSDIFDALATAQGEMKNPVKNKTATIRTKDGTYRYKYCDISDVLDCTRGPFSKNGINVTQGVRQKDHKYMVWNDKANQMTERVGVKVTLWTKLGHKSGQWVKGSVTAIAPGFGVQEVGSIITYLRRYGLCLLAGIAADADDDGEGAMDDRDDGGNGQQQRQEPARNGSQNEFEIVEFVTEYDAKDIGGGRTSHRIRFEKTGLTSTLDGKLGQAIGREKGTGLKVRARIRRVGQNMDLISGEVVPPNQGGLPK